jgi:hypothetical protein
MKGKLQLGGRAALINQIQARNRPPGQLGTPPNCHTLRGHEKRQVDASYRA